VGQSDQGNVDPATVRGFGSEWTAFDQSPLSGAEYKLLFDRYFSVFPFDSLPTDAEGFDLGCGSGRWAVGVAGRVGLLHCIDPAGEALEVARRNLSAAPNVRFHEAAVDSIPLKKNSQDFGYALGVLHHVPDTQAALRECVSKLKDGAPFLLYIYYTLEGRPPWFRALWRASDIMRRQICRLPFRLRRAVTTALAASVYWPFARTAQIAEKLGADVRNMPLSGYRQVSFYTMKTDALDRFGTSLEQRFSRDQIEEMMTDAGLVDIRFSEDPPFWVACGRRAARQ
jgi:ubiquinone/menaquinone biosynthesis C-methylase UbiE